MNLRLRFFLFLFVILILITGCATPRSEFTTFAQAGGAYAVAVNKLLFVAGSAQVDSTSWSIVANKEDTGEITEKDYDRMNKADLERLVVIQRLSQQAQLLGQYFGMLESLATSDSPQRTQEAIGGIIKGLQSLNLQLPQGVAALPALGQTIVDLRIRKALQEELDARKETIRAELFIQEQLLRYLNKQIAFALRNQQQKMENTLVWRPLAKKGALTDPEKWVTMRHNVVYMAGTVEQLGQASQAGTKLRQAFEGLLSGEVTIGRLNALISDIQALLEIAKTIKS